MKRFILCLMAIAMVSPFVACNKNKEDVPPQQEQPTDEGETSPLEMYVTLEEAGWDNLLFSTDEIGGWWYGSTGSFTFKNNTTYELITFRLERGNIAFEHYGGVQEAFLEFYLNFPLAEPLMLDTKYYFGDYDEETDADLVGDGVVVPDSKNSDYNNYIELRTGMYNVVSTRGWVKFTRLESDEAEVVNWLNMEFEFDGIAKDRDNSECRVVGGKIVDNPGECKDWPLAE